MHLVMFDIDDTLVRSDEFDGLCYTAAVREVLDLPVDTEWGRYVNVTDRGILEQILEGDPRRRDLADALPAVKAAFVRRVEAWLRREPLAPVPGAAAFLDLLRQRGEVAVALATGGWRETALLKLEAAGLDVAGIPLATSSDHASRIDIMRLAEQRAGSGPFLRRSYFGDGAWDQAASRTLGYDFVLVGDRVDHAPAIADYTDPDRTLALLGL